MSPDRPASHLTAVVSDDGIARPSWASTGALMRHYYDTEWGIPVHGEQAMFELLSLETFQAGMSWEVVLRKRPVLREQFHDFDPDVVAGFTEEDVERILSDPGGIRNQRKIEAVIANAHATLALRMENGLAAFVWSFMPTTPMRITSPSEIPAETPESALLAKALRRRGFRYVGARNMFALMEAAGIVDTRVALVNPAADDGECVALDTAYRPPRAVTP